MFNLFSKTAAGPVEFLVVGLGNPGREYENTRHNAGFMAVDRIAETIGVKIDRLKFKSLCAEGMMSGRRVRSGGAGSGLLLQNPPGKNAGVYGRYFSGAWACPHPPQG